MTALRQQRIDAMVLRGLSPKAQEAYLRAGTPLAAFHGRSPDRISEREIQTYRLHLYREKRFSHSTCNVAVAGLRFFYPVTIRRRSTGFVIPAAREPSKLPEILTREELTRMVSRTVRPKHRALLLTAHAEHAAPTCSPSRTSMSSSRCPTSSAGWPSVAPVSSTICSSARRATRSRPSLGIRSTGEGRSASRPSSTPGARPFRSIPICTAW